MDALEYLHSGDTAIAAMQYSYLPSWVSFVGDRSTPVDAGRALFEAVIDDFFETEAEVDAVIRALMSELANQELGS